MPSELEIKNRMLCVLALTSLEFIVKVSEKGRRGGNLVEGGVLGFD